jgi:hypothetical protein
MGMKYCLKCRKVALTKALSNYLQVDFKGIRGKRRKIVHLEEDGGCGHEWYTVEVAEDVLDES